MGAPCWRPVNFGNLRVHAKKPRKMNRGISFSSKIRPKLVKERINVFKANPWYRTMAINEEPVGFNIYDHNNWYSFARMVLSMKEPAQRLDPLHLVDLSIELR